MPKLNELRITLTWKQITRFMVIIAAVVGGYYQLLKDIRTAMEEPRPPITRVEFDLKFENTALELDHLKADLARLEDELEEERNENP